MADVTKPYTFTNQTTADANQVNQDFDTLYTAVNGGLDNNNIKSGSLSTAIATEGVTQSQTKGVPYAIDLYGGPFLFSGFTVTKDGTTLTQVNVTAGVALTKQTDGNLRRITTSATNFRVATNSATYYLDLNPDGSWWWANSGHSTQSNYINVATVTSDGSGNVATVTQNTASYTINLLSGSTGGTNFLRTDSGAPNPQTVSNGVTFNGQVIMPNGPWYMTNALGTGKSTQFGTTTNVQGVTSDLFAIAEEGTQWVFGLDHNGNLGITGNVYTYSGQLGSASGTWTPAGGQFSGLVAGSTINIAAVPSASKTFSFGIDWTGASGTYFTGSGVSDSTYTSINYAFGTGGAPTVAQLIANGTSTSLNTYTNHVQIADGTYEVTGYFRISGGYLQFYVLGSASTLTSGNQFTSTVHWGVA